MVKRKAGMSIDEWLDSGVISPPTNPANTSATTDVRAPGQCPTVEGFPPERKGQLITGGQTNVTRGLFNW